MKKQEADFSITFRHWLRANYEQFDSASFEIKDVRGKPSFSLKELKEEQINHGLANKSSKGNLTRVSSGTVGAADYHFYRNAYAYVVVKYNLGFVVIDIDDIPKDKKSLTWEDACEIAVTVVKS